MRYKHLNSANTDVSVLGVGTWALGNFGYGEVTEQDSVEAIRVMLDRGVNLIDTAPVYGEGHSEEVVGRALKGLDRSKLLISSKFGIGSTTMRQMRCPEADTPRDGSFANVLYECEQSLRRLGTDYIDFYFVHWPDYDTPLAETMEALKVLKRQGKIRFIGVSNFSREQILEGEKFARIDVIQPPFSMVVRRDRELMKWAKEKGIDSITYGSLGAGILTGAFRTPPIFGDSDPRSGFYPFFKEPHFSKVLKVLEVMDKISAQTGRPLAQIALNWTVQQDFVDTALCGVRSTTEAQENCATFDWALTEEQMAELNEAVEAHLDFDGAAPMQ